jgi:hypothetical protein
MDIVENILIWDSTDQRLKDHVNSDQISLKELSHALNSDEVAEEVDISIDTIIAHELSLKKVLGSSDQINRYINAVLLDTELKE